MKRAIAGLFFYIFLSIGTTLAFGSENALCLYPLDNWTVMPNCGFGKDCARANHLGTDAKPGTETVIDTPVYAPCPGIVKEARLSTGYGGIVILEVNTGGTEGTVTIILAHMDPNQLKVKAGDTIPAGKLIGYIGDSNENGGWEPHLHIGVHKGAYNSTCLQCSASSSTCDGKVGWEWTYAGYTACPETVFPQWYDPEDFLKKYTSTQTSWCPCKNSCQ